MSQAVARPASLPLAWWGMLMLVASEGTLFGCLFGTYFFLRSESTQWPPQGVPAPALTLPIALTAALAVSALPLGFASRRARAGGVWSTPLLVVAALAIQGGYFGVALHDFDRQLDSFTPQTDAYGSIYYVLLGADHAHVAAGLLLDVWLLLKLTCGLTAFRMRAVRAVALYWYAVALLTVLVTATLLSARV